MANNIIPHFNNYDPLQTAGNYTNAVVLAANVPQILTIPFDENQQLARVITLSKTGDFYAKPLVGTDALELTVTPDVNWTAGSGWVVSAGVATATTAAGTLSETVLAVPGLVSGKQYLVTFAMTRSAGSITAALGGGSAGTSRALTGTYSELITAGAGQTIVFTSTGFTGTITLANVSIVKGIAVPAAAVTDGSSPDLNPAGYMLNRNITKVMVVSAGTPVVTAAFFK